MHRHWASTNAPLGTTQRWRICSTSYVPSVLCGTLAMGCTQPEWAHRHPELPLKDARHWSHPLLLGVGGAGISSNGLNFPGFREPLLQIIIEVWVWILDIGRKIWQVCPGQLCCIQGSELPTWGTWRTQYCLQKFLNLPGDLCTFHCHTVKMGVALLTTASVPSLLTSWC